jgi:hypothetical protein
VAGFPDLDELIAIVEERAVGEEPLARLEAASSVSYELGVTADALLGHFVETARAAGLTWAQIGGALGVSKQGAQQRFMGRSPTSADLLRVVSRAASRRLPLALGRLFTRRARNSVHAAAREAQRLNDHVGTEHLLLGLLQDPESLSVKALEHCGVPAENVRAAVDATRPSRDEPAPRPGAFRPSAARALERSMGEALRLGHNYIGTEHILLVLVNEKGPGGETLRGLGLTRNRIEEAVVELLGQEPPTG